MSAGLETEEAFLNAIAARPEDGALRRVFCDWLLEHNDPRGEVMVLSQQGELSSADRRRQERLTRANAHKWLGPLAPAVMGAHEDDAADGLQVRFFGGLLQHVHFRALTAKEWRLLVGEPRLATVSSAVFPADARWRPPAEFLSHRVLANLTRLECGAALLEVTQKLPFAPQWLHVHTSKHKADLQLLSQLECVGSVTELVLSIETLRGSGKNAVLTSDDVSALVEDLFQASVIRDRSSFELSLPTPTVETVALVMMLVATNLRRLRQRSLQRFTVRYRDTPFSLHGEQLQFLEIDPGSRDGEWTVDARFSAAAAVISQLSGLALQLIEVKAPPGGRVTRQELDALRAAARRLRSLESLIVAGVKQPP